jgi:hypothetical protein
MIRPAAPEPETRRRSIPEALRGCHRPRRHRPEGYRLHRSHAGQARRQGARPVRRRPCKNPGSYRGQSRHRRLRLSGQGRGRRHHSLRALSSGEALPDSRHPAHAIDLFAADSEARDVSRSPARQCGCLTLRLSDAMAPVRASTEPQRVPRRLCRVGSFRRARTRGPEAAAAPPRHRGCASPR